MALRKTEVLAYLRSKEAAPFIDIALFMIITLGLHKLWWLTSGYIYSVPMINSFAGWLADEVFAATAWINIHILRMDIRLAPDNLMIFLKNNTMFYVNESCSGFKQMCQILVLFVLFPGPWKHKLWFIPAGIVAMFFVNVLRVIGLSYAMIWLPQHWDFIHLWIMRPFYYVAIFLMWVLWVEKFRPKKSS
jgi:exosortase/archaeosortase family protein